MLLNRRHRDEEKLLRKLMVLIRLSGDKSIKDQQDVGKYVRDMYNDLGFEETRDIMLAWSRIHANPERYVRTELADEIIELFKG